jgi:hypothetical protein
MKKVSKTMLFGALFLGGAAWAGHAAYTDFFDGSDGRASDAEGSAASARGTDGASADENGRRHGPSITMKLPVSTQGPLWPPAEVTDADGNYLLIGNALKEVAPGVFGMVPNQAVVVSKDTVPPLDANGVEDSSNWFGAPHKILRNLNLQKGSPDLNIELRSLSFGPHTDGITSSPRIPRQGESQYNMNKGLTVCADNFPTIGQHVNYFRPSYPLNKVPVLGFQGDGVAYDPATGNSFDPQSASNDPSCAANGCPGEDPVDTRRTKPITLGDWARADGKLKIELTKPNRLGQYTQAEFDFTMKDMLPNSVYTVWVVRGRQLPFPGRKPRVIDPIATPNVIVTDGDGRAHASFEVGNPFPDPATDVRGMRIIGLSVVYHSDQQNWGACFSRFGAGVDVHVQFNTLNKLPKVPGTLPDFTEFVTVER